MPISVPDSPLQTQARRRVLKWEAERPSGSWHDGFNCIGRNKLREECGGSVVLTTAGLTSSRDSITCVIILIPTLHQQQQRSTHSGAHLPSSPRAGLEGTVHLPQHQPAPAGKGEPFSIVITS